MMNSDSIPVLIDEFFSKLGDAHQDIYNEISLQLELGIFLRQRLQTTDNPNRRVQFERNIRDFVPNTKGFVKKEIDISIVDDGCLTTAIELKFPTNGQVPEQMFKFCEDIRFTEQLIRSDCQSAFVLVLADRQFYSSAARLKGDGIYAYFRRSETLEGRIQQPTGDTAKVIELEGSYSISWNSIPEIKPRELCYTVIEAK